ncbi:type 1 glutamine amidotransferase family protein [Staphylococcus ratti]|uniref:Glutamine amidotransferase n=1 Tax=Staphylococcus ratti TaxID=2892440 RepID=A0ABY3PC49_9STAP|nr:type 1 glutamine amidotransferase family protein [Staphylococcus ratti]UEX89907.1 glutamine amidotransferase [Staphylococcus ratti]
MKKALFLLLDQFADWESAYLSSMLNQSEDWEIKTISLNKTVTSIGNFAVTVDYEIGQFDETYDLLILIGGNTWNVENEMLYHFIKQAFANKIPIGAICGAVDYLAKNGFLNDYKHTGNALSLWKGFNQYENASFFIEAQAIRDGHLVTANGTAPIEFMEHILKLIEFDTPENIERKMYMIQQGYYRYCRQYGNPYI